MFDQTTMASFFSGINMRRQTRGAQKSTWFPMRKQNDHAATAGADVDVDANVDGNTGTDKRNASSRSGTDRHDAERQQRRRRRRRGQQRRRRRSPEPKMPSLRAGDLSDFIMGFIIDVACCKADFEDNIADTWEGQATCSNAKDKNSSMSLDYSPDRSDADQHNRHKHDELRVSYTDQQRRRHSRQHQRRKQSKSAPNTDASSHSHSDSYSDSDLHEPTQPQPPPKGQQQRRRHRRADDADLVFSPSSRFHVVPTTPDTLATEESLVYGSEFVSAFEDLDMQIDKKPVNVCSATSPSTPANADANADVDAPNRGSWKASRYQRSMPLNSSPLRKFVVRPTTPVGDHRTSSNRKGAGNIDGGRNDSRRQNGRGFTARTRQLERKPMTDGKDKRRSKSRSRSRDRNGSKHRSKTKPEIKPTNAASRAVHPIGKLVCFRPSPAISNPATHATHATTATHTTAIATTHTTSATLTSVTQSTTPMINGRYRTLRPPLPHGTPPKTAMRAGNTPVATKPAIETTSGAASAASGPFDERARMLPPLPLGLANSKRNHSPELRSSQMIGTLQPSTISPPSSMAPRNLSRDLLQCDENGRRGRILEFLKSPSIGAKRPPLQEKTNHPGDHDHLHLPSSIITCAGTNNEHKSASRRRKNHLSRLQQGQRFVSNLAFSSSLFRPGAPTTIV